MEFNYDNFYNNIYCLIKNKGIKIGVVEKYCKLHIGSLSRHKRDLKPIAIDTAFYISKCLGCSIDDLCSKDFSIHIKKQQIRELEEQIEILKRECNE